MNIYLNRILFILFVVIGIPLYIVSLLLWFPFGVILTSIVAIISFIKDGEISLLSDYCKYDSWFLLPDTNIGLSWYPKLFKIVSNELV